ncbi:MAG TPA: hypothetical protein VL282_13010 [Tepidisphaeraceae bacterium]|jgi:hypothetical protein|nr:hypothetical protein [Tepidisphaeraceae bacterium]
MIRFLAAVASLSILSTAIVAQPATGAASAPATTQRARFEIIIPPGFQKVTIGGHTVLAEPTDLPWITEALTNFKPTTRPTTMPADLMASLKEVRPQIEKQLADDLGINDPKLTTELFEQILYPNLTRLGEMKPPLFYLVTTRDRLKQLLRDGWRDPRLHYNKVSDEVQFTSTLELNVDGPMDDYIVPAVYAPDTKPEQRREQLGVVVNKTEQGLTGAISVKGQAFVHTAIMNFIGRNVFAELKPAPSQEWLSMGASSTLAAKYTALANHMDFKLLMARMTADNPKNPISSRTIDLAHPTNPTDLRREALPFYVDALGKKSMVVVMKILDQGGADAIKKIVAAFKEKKPRAGDELVKLIKDATGVDVSEDVKAK